MKNGFTLAEVLITLGVIGVVSAITLPTLINKYQEQVMVNQTKKVYNQFSQAYQMAVLANGSPINWEIGGPFDTEANVKMFNIFKPYLKIIKECEPENNSECFEVYDSNFINKSIKTAVLADGTKFYMFGRDGNCRYLGDNCATIRADYKNMLLEFWIAKNGIFPVGGINDVTISYSFEGCYSKYHSKNLISGACTAWIIYNGNMDFRHCDDLSWSGKTKCK